jgi:putative transposase
VPLAVVVAGANRHDTKLARRTLEGVVIERPGPTKKHPQNMCMDKGYDFSDVDELVAGGDTQLTSRGEVSTSRSVRRFRATVR